MSTTEKAWLAGFIDGEGSIGFYLAGRNRTYPAWYISVPNTHKGSLDYCKIITGTGTVVKKKAATERTKEQFQWRVNPQREIAAILKQIFPYLVIKRAQAEKFLNSFVDLP